MDREAFIRCMAQAKLYDLTQDTSIFTPPWPGEKSLEVHFFKRVTGAYGGGQGANGQILNWSNTVGTHLVGETAFHSGGRAISDIPLSDLCGQGVVVDISDLVSDYGFYTPAMIMSRARVKRGDILIVNTGYHRYSWDQPDVLNPNAQGGVESKEFGFLVRHPGPSPDFFQWAMEMKLKLVGVDCGCAEHPMNTPIRRMHENHFKLAEAKLLAELQCSAASKPPPFDTSGARLPGCQYPPWFQNFRKIQQSPLVDKQSPRSSRTAGTLSEGLRILNAVVQRCETRSNVGHN